MSSEMRELIAKWRSEVDGGPDRELKEIGYDACLLDCADELEALLARTEAGADGSVAWILRTGHGTALHEGPRPPVEGVGWRPLFTRPQDASGDAERAKKYEELIYAVGNKYPGETRHETALRYIRQAESHVGSEGCVAMQAKEAK